MIRSPIDASELSAPDARQNALHPVQLLRSVGFSFLINGLCPYLIYAWLEPYYSPNAVQPLIYASIFPVIGLAHGIARKRMVDAIAVIALLAILTNVAGVLFTPSLRWALVARSLDGVVAATALFVSALIRKPLFYYVARQFVMANDPASVSGFDAINVIDGRRTFRVVTFVWAAAVYMLCVLNVTLAFTVPPASYLLVSQVTTMTVMIALTVWTIRFTHVSFTAMASRAESAGG